MAFLDFLPIIGGAASAIWDSTVGQKQSKDLMRYQYELNQQAIENQNRYNSPVAQMERLRAAGLNPNLVYGNGVEGNQSSAPNVGIANRSQHSDFGFAEAVSNVFRRRQLENESNLTTANVEKLRADKLLSSARYLDVLEDVARKDATFKTFVEQEKQKLRKLTADTQLTEARRDNTRQQTNNLEIIANNLIDEGKLLAARTRLTSEQALTEIVRRRSLEAGIKLSYAQAEKIAHEIPFIDAGVDLRTQEHEQKGLEFAATDELNKWLSEHPNVELTVDIAREVLGAIGGIKSGRHGKGATKKRRRKK